jgi:hypothetical protein
MEDSENTFIPPIGSGERKQPVVLIAQLMRSIAQMRHVDEVFVWLSNALVRSLELPVVQLWKTELDNRGRFQAELRALTTQDGSLPQEMHLNSQVLAMIERLFHERRSVMSLPIQYLFPPLQASLFAVYGLHYWAGYFLDSDAVCTPARTVTVSKPTSTPLTIIVSFFTAVPLSVEQMRAIHFVLKQTMRIIMNRRFQTFQNSLETAQENTDTGTSIALADVIPTRAQNLQQLQAANPFAHASIIVDKKARRLYSAIDGCRSVTELAQITHLTQKELTEALRYLFQQQKIEFYTVGGEYVEDLPPVLSASWSYK